MILVVNLNTNHCRMYQYDKNHSQLTLVREISHPENRMKASEYLTNDKPGRYQHTSAPGSAYEPRMDPKEVEIDRFSKEIADVLDKERKANTFEKLIVITEPNMNGHLFQHLSKHVKNLVTNNIQKDLQHLNDKELAEYLKTHAHYPDK